MPVRVMIESGKRKVVASAFDWPGWDRNGRSEEDALRTLAAYRARYSKVAALAGLADELEAAGELEVVERVEGTSTTDYFGISVRSAAPERVPMSEADCDRKLRLLRASWAYFDSVHPRVSAELRKGPRGGGRDRDLIVRHTLGSEREFAAKVGVVQPPAIWQTPDALPAHREAYLEALRQHNAAGLPARAWTLQFTIRRSAFHMLDHAWEMEDRDLSNQR